MRASPAGPSRTAPTTQEEAGSLYKKLEKAVVPLYLRCAGEVGAPDAHTRWPSTASYFNTNRMVKQYARNAYYPVKLIEKAKVEEEAFAK